jgi:murein DD-endopeptidase MepM/ murein hydrolase activator NlpD
VGEFQIGELIALTTDGNRLFLLDKRGDVYGYDPASGQWSLERPIDQRRVSPNPVFPALAAFDGRIYLLDTGYRQIWRHPYGDGVRESYLPEEGVPDLARGIGLGVDGDVYVLLREGQDGPAGLLRFLGASAAPDPAFAATLERPTFLYLAPNGGDVILVIDRDGHRLQALERSSARPLAVLAFADESVEMRGAFLWEGRLYLSTPGALYVYPGYGETYFIRGAEGPLPEERPDDLRRLSALGPFIPPIAGLKYLPERDSLLPGSPRVYRFGIHQGLDLYGGTAGVEIPYGTPVLAVAAGRVIRADHGYQEMTLDEWEALVAECVRLHRTPPEILDRLRGRQVWIDHGDGLVTRYVHLAGIPDEVISGTLVQQGQVIGYAGNSGTSEGAEGSQRGTHLHFEVVVDGSYLGKWLSLWEVRRLLERLFFPTGSP